MIKLVALRHPDVPRQQSLLREARKNLRRYALGRPIAYTKMMAAKVRRTWLLSSRIGQAEASGVVRVGHAVLVVLCFVTSLVAFIRRRTVAMALLLATVLYSAAVHAVFVAKPRYNLPPLPLLESPAAPGP